MKKRTQKSQKRTKFLLLLLVLTAILSITATYAWFSTQRDVEITGMRLNVEVAESMQISLDGSTWVQSIAISDMKQFYGTASGTSLHQAVKIADGTNTNYVPTELLPVSSVGSSSSGIMKFVQGTVGTGADGKTTLKSIKACDETTTVAKDKTITERQNGNSDHPYLVFDMYLRNISSAKPGNFDPLYLNESSRVWVDTTKTEYEGAGVAGTGLEYSARVGLIKYGNTVSVTATETEGTSVAEQVRTIASSAEDQVAIWEPNHLDHTPYVVSNNSLGITQTSQAVTTYAIKDTVTSNIADIYNTADTTNLQAVDTFTPAYGTTGVSSKSKIELVNKGNGDETLYMGLAPNAISKVRVYVWLEGQDPDCIDMASTGDKLNINLRLMREPNSNGGSITYDTAASTNNNT